MDIKARKEIERFANKQFKKGVISMMRTHIKDLLGVLGFTSKNGENNIYIKVFSQHANFSIEVDFNEQKINYGDKIKLWDNTTTNFSHLENLVVLECVNRLLEQGYKPQNIELEKHYLLGHKNKGKVDVLVNNKDNTPFLMIECKTWGQEYEKEKSKMLKDGGQLFSYYTNDRAVKYLCLYASKVNEKVIQYTNIIVPTLNEWQVLSGTKEIVEHWNKNFKDNGIFENGVKPYVVEHKALTYDKLLEIKQEDSGKIFNQIMEILRHNVVSDKPNAFNKLLNLFVCKIIDEDKQGNSELEFQWLETDNDESLQMRLNDLYSLGMHRFLNITVTDYQENVIDEKLAGFNDEETKKQIKEMFIRMRLQKNPEFAFMEVCDDKTFKAKGRIIKELVELLQVYKFRYNQKHQFLGDFFELLLNTSMKQEAGQFFTPNPITKFIIYSLPIEEFVNDKIAGNETEVLPKTIDFACGSGHFLTEYMEQLQNIIEQLDIDNANRSVKNQVNSWKSDVKFSWAKDYVYGIDLDYRLVKTAKVSAFFNGDGEANIVWANGLANFKKTPEYTGSLNHIGELNDKDNGQFDIVISNPPYSVEAFKKQIDEHSKETFDLYNNLTNSSKEIECLFVERTKQLLKEGGKVGIILPSSILSNGGIHSKAREILFKYFKFKAIAEMGSNTFMKTGTNTVILFLERRANGDWQRINTQIVAFFNDYRDVTVGGIENAFSKYVRAVYDIDFADYKAFIKGKSNDGIKESDLVRNYAKFESKDIQKKEQEKMLYFLLTYPQKIVLIKSGEKQVEKNFLGYEFSERRGHEGIRFYPSGTKLYDDNDKLNPQKVNSYIYNTFLGKIDLDIDEELSGHLSYARMSEFIDFNTNGWDKKVNLNKKKKIYLFADGGVSIKQVAEVQKGTSITRSEAIEGNISVVAGGIAPSTTHNKANRKENIITVSASGANSGYVNWWSFPIFASDCNTILSLDENTLATKYLYYLMTFQQKKIYSLQRGQAQPHVYKKDLEDIIPLPPIDIQKKIITEIEVVEKQEKETQEKQQIALSTKQSLIENTYKTSLITLKNVANYSDSRINCAELSKENYVGVDNLVANLQGKISTKYLPQEGTATAYKANNILISNIRPYLKKIWLADNSGGASGDILVLDIFNDNMLPQFLYNCLAIDNFFDYEMQNIKGVKMPRADKTAVLNYKIPLPPIEKQKEIVREIEKCEAEIAEANVNLEALKLSKKEILKTYLE